MNTETVEISKLKQDPDNARTHDAKNLAAIVGSLKIFGQQKPIVIDKKNRIVAGNGTVTAALELGWTEISAVRTKLTGDKAKAFALADNRTAELADWDRDILKVQLGELVKVEMDIKALGFDLDEVGEEGGSGDSGLTDPDQVPEVPQNVFGVQRGDIWQLGEHRVMCGDSTDKGDVDLLLDGAKADMVFTDPPYGMRLDTNFLQSDRVKGNSYKEVLGDNADFDPSFILDFFGNVDEIFLWGADYFFPHLPRGGSFLVWDKRMDELEKAVGNDFELCWSKKHHKRLVYRKLWSGFTAKEKGEKRAHPTQKPVDLSVWFFDRWGKSKNLIVDIFLGSGSTLIACEKTNRKCYGSEIDPHYCSVIIKRWQDFSGQEAKRIAKG